MGPRDQGWDALTDREWQVIELLCQGLTNPAIGAELSLSPRTVQSHLYRIFQKLGVSSRTELVAAAVWRREFSRLAYGSEQTNVEHPETDVAEGEGDRRRT